METTNTDLDVIEGPKTELQVYTDILKKTLDLKLKASEDVIDSIPECGALPIGIHIETKYTPYSENQYESVNFDVAFRGPTMKNHGDKTNPEIELEETDKNCILVQGKITSLLSSLQFILATLEHNPNYWLYAISSFSGGRKVTQYLIKDHGALFHYGGHFSFTIAHKEERSESELDF